jgi:hypothetical protein
MCLLALTCLLAFVEMLQCDFFNNLGLVVNRGLLVILSNLLELILGSILFLDDEVLKLSTYNFTSALDKIGILKRFCFFIVSKKPAYLRIEAELVLKYITYTNLYVSARYFSKLTLRAELGIKTLPIFTFLSLNEDIVVAINFLKQFIIA